VEPDIPVQSKSENIVGGNMPIPWETISREEALELLREYDIYIQEANDEDKFESGWRPVCINEFYDNEWRDILEQLGPYWNS